MSGIKTRSGAKSLVTSNLPSGTGGVSAANHRAVENAILDSAVLFGEAEVRVIDMDTTSPPGSPSDRDQYVVASGGSGDWSGKDGQIAVWDASVSPPAWFFVVPTDGLPVYNLDDSTVYRWDASASPAAWVAVSSGGGGSTQAFAWGFALSDETTDIETGTAKLTFRMPFAATITAVRANVATAPTGSTITVDVNENGSSILSTKLTIDAGEKTSVTAATPAVISDSSVADDAEITVDIDQVGSSTPGKGLKFTIYGTWTP